VTELFHVHGPSLLAAGIGSATVIWQTNKGNDEVKKELKKEIQDVRTEIQDVRTEIQDVRTEIQDVRTEIQGVQSIALGSAYATMRALSGQKDMMATWMQDIEKCIRSDGKDCASVKGIANAQNKK
jgi:chromosome segregation ATPase